MMKKDAKDKIRCAFKGIIIMANRVKKGIIVARL